MALVVTLRFVPCFNNLVAMGKGPGIPSSAVLVVAINGSPVLLAGLVRWALVVARIFVGSFGARQKYRGVLSLTND